MIYLDSAATCIPVPIDYNSIISNYGNPSSEHRIGLATRDRIESIRKKIQRLFMKQTAIFTSGGTESNHLAILGALRQKAKPGNILLSSIEHASILKLKNILEKIDIEVHCIPVDTQGIIKVNHLKEMITDQTQLISVQTVNNETGVIQPIEKIAAQIKSRKKNILFHTDHSQDFLKIDDAICNPCDLISLSAHKIGGLNGC